MILLADQLSQPDDLLLEPDGSIYLSDVGDGTVKRYTQANGLQPFLSGLSVPEGMVVLPDGSLIIAEQGKNRLIRYDPATRALTDFLRPAQHHRAGGRGWARLGCLFSDDHRAR